jgi:hypothetical protein
MHLQNDKRGLLSIKGFDVEHDDVFYLSSNDLRDEELRTIAKDGRVPVTITLDLEKADQDTKEEPPRKVPKREAVHATVCQSKVGLMNLPHEILEEILIQLAPRELAQATSASQKLLNVMRTPGFRARYCKVHASLFPIYGDASVCRMCYADFRDDPCK